MIRTFARFLADERGATAIEYGLIAALVCVAIISALTTFAGKATTMWNTISNKIGGAM